MIKKRSRYQCNKHVQQVSLRSERLKTLEIRGKKSVEEEGDTSSRFILCPFQTVIRSDHE